MKILDFYKELYFKENERRQEVTNSLNIPIGVNTALLSGTYFLISSFDYKLEYFLSGVFVLMISVSLISIIISCFYLIQAFKNFNQGYDYTGLPYPADLNNWYSELDDYYNGNKQKTNIHFEKYLVEQLAKHTSHNMFVNDQKHAQIYKSKKYLIVALITTLFSLIPYEYNYFNNQTAVHKLDQISKK